jgi:hypothetical protein
LLNIEPISRRTYQLLSLVPRYSRDSAPRSENEMNQNLKAQMKRIPLIAGVFGLIMISIGLAGLFVEKLSNNDGALLISGAIILSSLLIDWRSPKN